VSPLALAHVRATIATMTTVPTLRVARPSNNLDALLRFYEQGLGLTLLFRFKKPRGIRRHNAWPPWGTLPLRVYLRP
jgi:hypothetical protein